MGKCCVVGASELGIDEEAGVVTYNGQSLKEGEWITVDGSTGTVYAGKVATVAPELSEQFRQLMQWADKFRELGVRTNADTPADAAKAREFGAEGIGLTRTEHMFFEGNRIQAMREMILASDVEARKVALAKLLPMQRDDFLGIFKAMDGLPVTIRLLDPPLHEFLPHEEEVEAYAKAAGVPAAFVRDAVERHHEANPMLGHRGCRLGMTFPEISEMQAQAIFEAAAQAAAEGVTVHPEVMVPLIADIKELNRQKTVIKKVADEVQKKTGKAIDYKIGTMIELPRAALTAGTIAQAAEFFSFGTNDLTQTTYGLSRDDAGKFLPFYVEQGIFPDDPFQTLDTVGVGQLVEIATREGRATRPDLKVGICGEHGGDPRSVEFCHQVGLNYVSCSPFRVPIARLAAAQAALKGKKGARLEAKETVAAAPGIPLGE
jgi:pyruvate,orthophosphate dikinase